MDVFRNDTYFIFNSLLPQKGGGQYFIAQEYAISVLEPT